MAWLPIALRYLDLLVRYGPYVYSSAVEIYRLIEKLRKEGQTSVAAVRKLSIDYELAAYCAMPKPWRDLSGIRNVRDAARREYREAKAMGLV